MVCAPRLLCALVPAKTPRDIVDKLSAEINRAMQDQGIK